MLRGENRGKALVKVADHEHTSGWPTR
jgi:hypothetical protein